MLRRKRCLDKKEKKEEGRSGNAFFVGDSEYDPAKEHQVSSFIQIKDSSVEKKKDF